MAINKIGVVGAGNMGSGIAQKIAQEGINVVLIDTKEEFVKRGISIIEKLLNEGVQRKVFSQEQMDKTLARITATTDLNAIEDADIVIEAIFEDKKAKSELFEKLDKICSKNTILATNTSSLFVNDFAKKTSRPDRFIGMHYFYHPAKNKLLEVIPAAKTSRATIEKTIIASKLHGKTPILVKDAPGFAVNRYFVPFLNEAARLLEENVANIATIEEAYKRAFRIGMGPFELMNVTGVQIAAHTSSILGSELGPFYMTCRKLLEQTGMKENWKVEGSVDESKIQAVMDRAYGVCLGIAASMIDDGVASIEDIDRGAKIGLLWAKGPFELMNTIGIDKTYEVVEAITKKYPDFKMPKMLKKQKKLGKPIEFKLVDLDIKGNIAYVTVNRPEAMNALNQDVVSQLDKKFTEAEKKGSVKAIVIQGAGKAFIAGADIKFFIGNIKNKTIDKNISFTRKGHELLLKIENSRKLTIALLDGLSLGGGSELALSAQAIVATDAGSMGFPETGIGIYPGLGGMIRFARLVGPELAKYYVFTGKTIRAEEAYELGIIARLVKPEEVDSAIKELVASGKPDKYRKRTIPAKYDQLIKLCAGSNVARLLSKTKPEGVDNELAEKTLKILSSRAPVALRFVNELIDQQMPKSIPEAVELELGRLNEIFSIA